MLPGSCKLLGSRTPTSPACRSARPRVCGWRPSILTRSSHCPYGRRITRARIFVFVAALETNPSNHNRRPRCAPNSRFLRAQHRARPFEPLRQKRRSRRLSSAQKPRLSSACQPRTTGFATAAIRCSYVQNAASGQAVAHPGGNWHRCHRSFISLRGVAHRRSFDLYGTPGEPVCPHPFRASPSGGSPGAPGAADRSAQGIAWGYARSTRHSRKSAAARP
jgi:hypothetical protein